LRLQLLNLAPLPFDFALLPIYLCLGLRLVRFLVLHRIPYREPADAAHRAADRSAGAWRAYSRADYRTGRRAQAASD
jgi:hypothetical protein